MLLLGLHRDTCRTSPVADSRSSRGPTKACVTLIHSCTSVQYYGPGARNGYATASKARSIVVQEKAAAIDDVVRHPRVIQLGVRRACEKGCASLQVTLQ